MNTNFERIRQIFQTIVEQPSAQWEALLDEACDDDQELRQQVALLLKTYAEGVGILDRNEGGRRPTGIYESLSERPGTMVGPYKLLQQIGEGGMGTVFMAEQTQPVQRKVALKVIKPGMDSRQVIARFEAERQALAMMDHVNIARVLDAGTTGIPKSESRNPKQIRNTKSEIHDQQQGVSDFSSSDLDIVSDFGFRTSDLATGRRYFVMELVHGVPITKYCDDNRLTPRRRLELFVPVCQAIQHAHQKGIIHRDIKPSNVMITLYGGKPVPKVIDFGVAKATEQRLTERTLFMQYVTMVGTLENMSPEQAEMSAVGADTRSDIFSLGVLLYELRTGSTPLFHKRVKEAAFAEVLRMIKEEEPPMPSTRLSDSGEALASISVQRHMEPGLSAVRWPTATTPCLSTATRSTTASGRRSTAPARAWQGPTTSRLSSACSAMLTATAAWTCRTCSASAAHSASMPATQATSGTSTTMARDGWTSPTCFSCCAGSDGSRFRRPIVVPDVRR
jgi:serine/threonine protein kinase